MKGILDQVARASRQARGLFQPRTAQEFFALRLAARLGDAPAARHYADLAEQHSEGEVLTAYRRALATQLDVARRFHAELALLKGRSGSVPGRSKLCAIRIERRAVAVAILDGERLQYLDSRQLPSSSEKAIDSAAGFIMRRIAGKFKFTSAALEIIPNGHEKQRNLLHKAVIEALRPEAVGILETAKADLFEAFGYPALTSRAELRTIMADIFPVLDQEPGQPWTHDAAALGLYVQTERLFNIIN